MVRIPTRCAPTHPGEMLLEEFLEPMGITQQILADAIDMPYQRDKETVKTVAASIPAPPSASPNISATRPYS